MTKRRREKSTAREPFRAFRELSLTLSVNNDYFKDTEWSSPVASAFSVDWIGFLRGLQPPQYMLLQGLVQNLRECEVPIASVLVGYTASFFDFQSQVAAAPTTDEIRAQLRLVRDALQRLGSLAQGEDGNRLINPSPSWLVREDEDPARRHVEEAMRQHYRRTSALHPMLQDHISMVYGRGVDILPESQRDAAIEALPQREGELMGFFGKIPDLIQDIKTAEQQCSEFARLMGGVRSVGTPPDQARNWALVRLMWIYRDVFGGDVKIYVRRTKAHPDPEPVGCMAFVVAALRHFSPVGVHELDSLARRLVALRKQIPMDSLILPIELFERR